jgi:hypothetical protein
LLSFFSSPITTSTALVDAALDFHRVGTSGDVLDAFPVDGLGQHGGGGGSVAGRIARLARDFANQLGSHVLVRVLQFDFLRHGHAVLGDRRGAELLIQNRVPALGTERRLDGIGELVHPAQDGRPCRFAIQ